MLYVIKEKLQKILNVTLIFIPKHQTIKLTFQYVFQSASKHL